MNSTVERYHSHVTPKLIDMATWTEKTGRARLRSFTDDEGRFGLEQNPSKRTIWAKLAREGHAIAWEFAAGGGYSGRMLVNGEILTPAEATKKFVRSER
jgi:hypothetical protein